jgi:diguanylate cyclase (GGDEF)-like protein/PAS domain S-box-containing protein
METDIWNLTLPSGFEMAMPPPPVILVVDDREENLFAMKKLLAKLNAEVITASSGADALALSLRHHFTLILLDVQMPSMNGFEVAEYLRENDETAHVPIIFLTAISKEERFVFQGYDSGAVDYIFKPVDPSLLLAKTRVFMDLAQQQSQLRRLALGLTELNERHLRLLEAMHEGVIDFDIHGIIRFANPMAQRLLNAPNSVVGQSIMRFIAGPDVAINEWQHTPLFMACRQHQVLKEADSLLYRIDGTAFAVEYSFGPFSPNGGPSGGVLVFSDITSRKQIEAALKRQATYDELTGIPNRALFLDTLTQATARAARKHFPIALFYLDLDGFKQVNDQQGHAMGDALLKAFCQRCRAILRTGDFMARIGGDEFVVLIEDGTKIEDLESLAQKLCDESSKAFDLNGSLVSIGVSIGIAYSIDGTADVDALQSDADSAMYEAKKAGKHTWRIHQLSA